MCASTAGTKRAWGVTGRPGWTAFEARSRTLSDRERQNETEASPPGLSPPLRPMESAHCI